MMNKLLRCFGQKGDGKAFSQGMDFPGHGSCLRDVTQFGGKTPLAKLLRGAGAEKEQEDESMLDEKAAGFLYNAVFATPCKPKALREDFGSILKTCSSIALAKDALKSMSSTSDWSCPICAAHFPRNPKRITLHLRKVRHAEFSAAREERKKQGFSGFKSGLGGGPCSCLPALSGSLLP